MIHAPLTKAILVSEEYALRCEGCDSGSRSGEDGRESGLLSEDQRLATVCKYCKLHCNVIGCRENTPEFQRLSERRRLFNEGLIKSANSIRGDVPLVYRKLDCQIFHVMEPVFTKSYDTFRPTTKIPLMWDGLKALFHVTKKLLWPEDDDLPP